MNAKFIKILFRMIEIFSFIAAILSIVCIAFATTPMQFAKAVIVVFLCLAISVVSIFMIRFRINTDEDTHQIGKYKNRRSDYEEKIRQYQNAINASGEEWEESFYLPISGVKNGFGIDLPVKPNRNTAFMMMPFTPNAVRIYNQCKKTLERCGINLCKSDDEYHAGNLLEYIIYLIKSSEYILVNIDGKNPNVFYELGVAHAWNKRTILISNYNEKEIPFNVQGYNILFYESEKDLDIKLEKAMKSMKNNCKVYSTDIEMDKHSSAEVKDSSDCKPEEK